MEDNKIEKESNNNINQENIEKLKALFPNCFKDNDIDFETLKIELGIKNELSSKEMYGLNWFGKNEAIALANKPTSNTLLPIYDKSMNFDEASNIIIEGDNLDVLKILRKSYYKKVDVIYIDPPYNTGNDFIYNDDYCIDKEEYVKDNGIVQTRAGGGSDNLLINHKLSGRFHTNWLNMIYPRLKLARELLKDDGVIFISIDDNEQARLKLVCDEIFGEENFVSDLIWIKKHGPGGNTSFNYKIINNNEYILCYAKKYELLNMNYIIHNSETLKKLGYINKDEYFKERGYYKLTHLYRPSSTGSFQYIETLDYPIKAPDGTNFYLHCNKDGIKRGRYTWGYDTYVIGNKLGFIECKKNDDGDWVAYRKQYQFVKFDPKNKKIIKIDAGQPYENIIDDFYSSIGGSEIVKIFNDKNIFDFPKPTSLIKHLLKIGSKKDSLILDFFAGSGTTGQAVMELNKEDGGNRKFILVQLPEEIKDNNEFKYISDITRERIIRSIKMFDYNDKGFKFFKQASSNFNNIEDNKEESTQQKLFNFKENTFKSDRTQPDILYQVILLSGLDLNTKFIKKLICGNNVYIDESNSIVVAIDNKKYKNIEETIFDIYKQNNNEGALIVYLVDQNFETDQDKINSINKIKSKIKDIVIRVM